MEVCRVEQRKRKVEWLSECKIPDTGHRLKYKYNYKYRYKHDYKYKYNWRFAEQSRERKVDRLSDMSAKSQTPTMHSNANANTNRNTISIIDINTNTNGGLQSRERKIDWLSANSQTYVPCTQTAPLCSPYCISCLFALIVLPGFLLPIIYTQCQMGRPVSSRQSTIHKDLRTRDFMHTTHCSACNP